MPLLIWGVVPPSPDWQGFIDGLAAGGHQAVTLDAQALTEVFGTHYAPEILLAYARAYRSHLVLWLAQAPHPPEWQERLRRQGQVVIPVTPVADWASWWLDQADRLTSLGYGSDRAPIPVPDLAETAIPAMVATALGHAREAAGETAAAKRYYREMLQYDPTDYSAHCGLARCNGTGETARRHWRVAAEHAGWRQIVLKPGQTGLPGVPGSGTNFAQEAANQWAQQAALDRAFDEMPLALQIISPYGAKVGISVARYLRKQGLPALAVRCLDIELAHWPEFPQTWRMRGDIAFDQGRYAEAQVDFERADALER